MIDTEAPRLPTTSSRDLNAACRIKEAEVVRDAAERQDRAIDVMLAGAASTAQ